MNNTFEDYKALVEAGLDDGETFGALVRLIRSENGCSLRDGVSILEKCLAQVYHPAAKPMLERWKGVRS